MAALIARLQSALEGLHVWAALAFLAGLVSVSVSYNGQPLDLSRPSGWFELAAAVLVAASAWYQRAGNFTR
jgi:hypothetical protein